VIKSLDPVSIFESEEDYMHRVSVKTKPDRDEWFKAILEARVSLSTGQGDELSNIVFV
jgi:hypothetical protein